MRKLKIAFVAVLGLWLAAVMLIVTSRMLDSAASRRMDRFL